MASCMFLIAGIAVFLCGMNNALIKQDFLPKYASHYIAATNDNHLLIYNCTFSNTVLVYSLEVN